MKHDERLSKYNIEKKGVKEKKYTKETKQEQNIYRYSGMSFTMLEGRNDDHTDNQSHVA